MPKTSTAVFRIVGGSCWAVLTACQSAYTQPNPDVLHAGTVALRREQPGDDKHAAGTTQVTGRAFHGIPIRQKSLYWTGLGEVDDSGIGGHALYYFMDGVAIGPGVNAAGWWTGGADIFSGEVEGLLRGYPIDGLPVFLEGTAGYQLANDQLPPGGTVWNFSFAFGFGAEMPVSESTDLQLGALYHHISNALGRRSSRNPSQNETRFWIGFATTL